MAEKIVVDEGDRKRLSAADVITLEQASTLVMKYTRYNLNLGLDHVIGTCDAFDGHKITDPRVTGGIRALAKQGRNVIMG